MEEGTVSELIEIFVLELAHKIFKHLNKEKKFIYFYFCRFFFRILYAQNPKENYQN